MFFLTLIPLIGMIYISFDYVSKYIYAYIIENKQSELYLMFFRNMSTNVKLRRKTINGDYILTLEVDYKDRPVEFVCNSKGHIKILGTTDKIIKTHVFPNYVIDSHRLIPNKYKQEFKTLIQSFQQPSILDISKFNGIINNSVVNNSVKIKPEQLTLFKNNGVIPVVFKRKIQGVYDNRVKHDRQLKKIYPFKLFVKDCLIIYNLNVNNITDYKLNDMITAKIYNYVY